MAPTASPGPSDQLRVLIVDDQAAVVKALQILLDLHGIPCIGAASPEEACAIAAAEILGAVIQDMNFQPSETSGQEGIDLFRSLRAIDPELPILLMTAWASLSSAVELIKEGASDYLEKPWNDDKLLASLGNLLQLRRLQVENRQLRDGAHRSRQQLAAAHDLRGLVYASDEMHRAVSLAVNVASSDAPVVITGPNGSGKERIAEIIQANSRRRDRPFIRVNLGAIPQELITSELFGAEAGAYTGLGSRRIGHFESADQGTLFLDEIDALSLAGQVNLLRVLPSGDFQRLGSSRTHHADVRIISATNADLQQAIAAGTFREDLFYRLNVVEIALPELRRRPDDILPLALHFLQQHQAGDRQLPVLGRQAERALLAYPWPGNVRELENRIRRATLMAAGAQITPADLGLEEEGSAATAPPGTRTSNSDSAESRQVIAALSRAQGVVAQAAAELGISRQALYRKMSRLGIELERRPREAGDDGANGP